jgi:hypothetical protein
MLSVIWSVVRVPVLCALFGALGLITGRQLGGAAARTEAAEQQALAAQQTTAVVATEMTNREQRSAKAERGAIAGEAHAQATTRTLLKEVIRYVSAQPGVALCSLDADGMRIWTAANAGDPAAGDPASGADGAVPGSAATGKPCAVGPACESRGSDGAVPRVSGAP